MTCMRYAAWQSEVGELSKAVFPMSSAFWHSADLRFLAGTLLMAAKHGLRRMLCKRTEKIDEIFAKFYLVVAGLCIGIGVILFVRVIIRFTRISFPMAVRRSGCMHDGMDDIHRSNASVSCRRPFRFDLLQENSREKWMDMLNILISLINVAFIAALLYYSILLAAIGLSPY